MNPTFNSLSTSFATVWFLLVAKVLFFYLIGFVEGSTQPMGNDLGIDYKHVSMCPHEGDFVCSEEFI